MFTERVSGVIYTHRCSANVLLVYTGIRKTRHAEHTSKELEQIGTFKEKCNHVKRFGFEKRVLHQFFYFFKCQCIYSTVCNLLQCQTCIYGKKDV